jgi:hypothetical protein
MKENIIYIAKLSASTAFSFLKINAVGLISTIVSCAIGFTLLSHSMVEMNTDTSGDQSFWTFSFNSRPMGLTLWILISISSPFLFLAFGNKYIVKKIAHRLITEKSETLIEPLLDKILTRFKSKQSSKTNSLGDLTMNKLQLIQEVKNDTSENKWLRKILAYGLRKIKLEDADFQQKQDGNQIIKQKTIQVLAEMAMPSKEWFWLLISVQWFNVLLLWFTKL